MNEPQVWTLIGVFGATLVGMFTMMSTMFVRVIRAEIGGLRGEMNAKFDGVQAQFDARFAKVDMRFDHLDRDIQALTRHVFPERD